MTEPVERSVHFKNVVAFVDEYLRKVYQRQVTDTTDAVWCPEWWDHTEALIRLDVLWRAWEHFRLNPRTGLSQWFVDHADPHMSKLLDPAGPFKYCSARHGHRKLLSPLPLQAPPSGLFDRNAGLSNENGVRIETVYGSMVEFVENYLSLVYQRQVTDTTETVWCPQWWQHPEALARLDALWRAWEFFRQDGTPGLSTWFIEHADPHMKHLMDPRGPFRYCSARHGHKALLSPLPSMEPPGIMFSNPKNAPGYQG